MVGTILTKEGGSLLQVREENMSILSWLVYLQV